MSGWSSDIRKAFVSDNGAASFNRILWDEEIGVLYFEHFGVSVTEVWLNGSTVSDDDFGVWSNNSLNNADAVVLWESKPVHPTLATHGYELKTCKFEGCDCDLPKEVSHS